MKQVKSPKKKPQTLPVVAVEWLDACFYMEDHQPLVPIPMITFGFIVEETADKTVVAAEVHADNVTRHHVVVPKKGGMGPKIHRLGRMKVPASILKYRKDYGY